jgi:hypothetical protein
MWWWTIAVIQAVAFVVGTVCALIAWFRLLELSIK